MVKRFTFFDMHQSGIYTAADCVQHAVGTRKVGPCIAFFLYNPETKSCLAMHMDAMTSLAVIKTEIRKFLPDYIDIEKCHAYLVGGWRSAVEEGDLKAIELPELLRELKVGRLETQLLKYNALPGDLSGTNVYNTIVLNLQTGIISVNKTAMHDFVPADQTTAAEKNLYEDCIEYMLQGGADELSGSVAKMLRDKPFAELRPEVKEVYQAIIDDNNGTPLIPARNTLELAAAQIKNLALQASCGNALEVLKLLYKNFVNPVSAVAEKLGNTPLHYACDALNKNPDSYNLKVIVLMLILHGKRDTPNDAGNVAMTKLKSPELQSFKSLCNQIMTHLNKYKRDVAVVGRIILVYRIIMAVVLDDVLEYAGTRSTTKKQEIEQRLLDSAQMVTLVNQPTSAAHAAAGLMI